LKSIAEAGIAEGHQDDGGAVVSRPDDSLNDVAVLAKTIGAQNLHRHDLNVVIADSSNSLLIIGASGDDPGEPCAVTIFIRESVGSVDDRVACSDDAG